MYLDRCAYLQIVGWAGAVGLPWAPAPPLPLPFPKCAKLLLRRDGVRAATLQFRDGESEGGIDQEVDEGAALGKDACRQAKFLWDGQVLLEFPIPCR